MVPDINFLLVGNSRLHWAKYSKNQSIFFHTKKEQKVPANIDLDQLIWASVGKLPNFLLKKENEIKTKDIQLSNLPDYFGVDRAFACIAALKIIENPKKKDLLIADFGTILSITKLNSNGSIIGGQLLPGFLTQLKSMEQNTKNLKVPKKYDIPIKDFLINTEEAILKGVINSLTGVINSLFNPEKDILIICGGDSQLLTKSLKTKDINLSNLPDYFGIDRALACLAAQKIIENPLKKDLLIADFGTILSITKLNSNGSIIGGQLTPGFLTQLKSMEQNTKNLTVPKKYDIPIKDFLINTEEAILKGVINSLTGVIHSLFNPEKDILVICGGDSELLTKSLKTQKENIINAPDLVMEGMIIHYLSIKN